MTNTPSAHAPNRPGTLETTILAVELLRRIPRGRKITAKALQTQLHDAGIARDLRTIQRQLELLSQHFEIERDERSKPYGYCWKAAAPGFALASLSPQESLLLQLAQQQLQHLLPARLMQSMAHFFVQAERTLNDASAPQRTELERQWPEKVRVVASTQPLLAPTIAPGVFEAVSNALYANLWLQVHYRNAAGHAKTSQVMPLGLAQQGPCLYLVCRFDGYDNERSLALHRIQQAQVSTLGFERPAAFHLQRYDEDGRFGFGEGQRVQLCFQIQKSAGFFLQETPLSLDQQLHAVDEEWLQVTATVVDSAMLQWWLRGFGSAVRHISLQAPNPGGATTA
jgi:predicted DNA-binding transcriptional regulator YafY